MNNYQLILSARNLSCTLDIIREEIIARLVKFVDHYGGAIGFDVIKVKQFINGTPHEVTGIRVEDGSPRLLIRDSVTDSGSDIPLEEASTPVLVELLEKAYNTL